MEYMIAEQWNEVVEVLSLEDFYARHPDDFSANQHWYYSASVRQEGDVEEWVRLRAEILASAWAPNQSSAEREEGALLRAQLGAKLSALEVI